ncbi:coiled-coil domain-containing protein 12-like [Bolinopsis microptera]|uniref:coiled-coil domain-containing protein 12-like n=1 Tax=Bolinopsis microptera TaxID=2820187 RepID=UPI003078F6C2
MTATVDETASMDSEEVPRKRLKFRCYKPHDNQLQGKQLEQVEATSIVSTVTGILDKATAQSTEVDLNTLAPRKANWDLKRDVEKKLSKLERRTKRAMAEMIREKLKAERDIIAGAGQDEGNDSD